jgi:hypothetical protein
LEALIPEEHESSSDNLEDNEAHEFNPIKPSVKLNLANLVLQDVESVMPPQPMISVDLTQLSMVQDSSIETIDKPSIKLNLASLGTVMSNTDDIANSLLPQPSQHLTHKNSSQLPEIVELGERGK